MSTLFNDEWSVGETWSWVVECTDADNVPIPIAEASFKLQREGEIILELDSEPYVSFTGHTVTVIVPTDNQRFIPAGVYERELYVTDDGNAISRQLHGDLTITRQPFTRAEVAP